MHFDMSWHNTDKMGTIYERDYNFIGEFAINENRVIQSGQSTEYNSWSHHLAAQTSKLGACLEQHLRKPQQKPIVLDFGSKKHML